MDLSMEKAANKPYRYEIKFTTNEYSYIDVIRILKLHPSLFREIFHARTINNVYFDSEDLLFYHENKEGLAKRTKYRIRWYGNTGGKIKPVLEKKMKFGVVGTKPQYPLNDAHYHDLVNQKKLHKLLVNSNLDKRVVEELQSLQPIIANSYDRRYFLCANAKFRMTIDYDLQYYSLKQYENMYRFRKKINAEKTVLELKFAKENLKEVSELTQNLPFRVSKNSKYVDAVEYVYGGVGMIG